MNRQSIDYTKQDFFLGIDVHKKSWKVTVRTNGMELKTLSMDPSPDQLYRYMHKRYPGGNYHSVYEAGFCGYWIDRELKRLGFNNIVINPADVPSTQKEKSTKTDKVDISDNRFFVLVLIPYQQMHLTNICSQIKKKRYYQNCNYWTTTIERRYRYRTAKSSQ